MRAVRIFSRQMVLPDSVAAAEIVIEGGTIAEIRQASAPSPGAADWGDDAVIPGLIDIHTDNLEKHFMPRPGTTWDSFGAALAHDAQCASAGITTVYDSLSLHGRKNGLDRGAALPDMIAAVGAAAAADVLRADHLLHLRCEVSNPELMALLTPHLNDPRLRMLSVMDHTPGQRTSANLGEWREKLRAQGKSETDIEAQLAANSDWRDASGAGARRAAVAEIARARALPLASHDDATEDQVQEGAGLGATICEFPVTIAAAREAHRRGMVNVMGAPNFVRGGSHGGNASARDIAQAGLLDALCSDYVPLSMLRAAFMMTQAPLFWPLPKAIDTVAGAPARMAGLSDRGRIAAGLRADIVRVRMIGDWPTPVEVWARGRRAA